MSHETNPENRCPYCRAKLDMATDTDGDAKPQPGDFSLCIRCGEMFKFTDGLRIEALADAEYQKTAASDAEPTENRPAYTAGAPAHDRR